MTRGRSVVLASLLAVAAVSCTSEPAHVVALRQALQAEYPGARFEVQFTKGPRHLEFSVDSAAFRNYKLDEGRRRAIGQAMARFALQHYGAAASLDSITVQFIQERSGALFWKSWAYTEESFAVAGLR